MPHDLTVTFGLWRLPLALMPPEVAMLAGCSNVGLGIRTAFLPCQKVFCSALMPMSLGQCDAMDLGEALGIIHPHGKVAVTAATLLTEEGLRTKAGELCGHKDSPSVCKKS
jgi:hypothetical protein